ncbi:telomerase reverse transcriptase [Novymonas esmeraldas]|uniref:Telomerase reverse transcriptase n=1 Tax=Novymonas esmeraldas TaxID=1808958 RepID=A0AAW0F495_9TRYP
MSASFPSIPGFIGPLSLKAFVDEFFGLHLTFATAAAAVPPSLPTAAAERAPSMLASLATRNGRDVVLPPTQSFLLVVYVAAHASSPPPPAAAPEQARQQQPHTATATKAGSGGGSSSSGGARARRQVSVPWLLYTNTSHRPFTDALLRHPWWVSLVACLGPAAMGFVELYCPIILQLEAMAGGVQVLGPPLRCVVVEPPTFSARGRGGGRRGGGPVHRSAMPALKRCASLRDGAAPPTAEKRRRVEAAARESGHHHHHHRHDRHHSTGVDLGSHAGGTSAAWIAALPRTDAPRTRLYSCRDTDCDDDGGDDSGAAPLPAGLLEAVWLLHHPRSLHCVLQAALPRAAAAYKTSPRGAVSACTRDAAPREDVSARHVAYVFRWLELRSPQESGDAVEFDVPSHLRRVLSTVVDQCSRLDLRGAALRHTSHLEDAYQRQQRGAEPWDVQRLVAPVEVVVSYVRTLLATLRWGATSGGAAATFWGLDAAGGERVLDALMRAVRGWLSAGRHATFPVSRFLDGVPVAQVPWLNGFYTKSPRPPSSSAARHARRCRSQVQQRVWLQFSLFLTQDIVPFLVRAAFTVTWSSKQTHTLLFVPATVWRWLVRHELRRARSATVAAASSPLAADRPGDSSATEAAACEAITAPPVSAARGGWRGVRSAGTLARRGAAATLATRSGGASCLYAGVRFRPDQRKLRPIAVVRSASLHSLTEMARGSPGPYSHAGAIARLLRRLPNRRPDGRLPPTTAALLRRVESRGVRRRARRLPAHQPHKAALRATLRCLVSGVEEQRVRDGLPRLSNLSHQDEYAELRSFCEEVRGRHGEVDVGCVTRAEVATAAPPVFLLRCDASRCYDSLPQERVLAAALALVRHDSYRVLSFAVLHAVEGGAAAGDGPRPLRRTRATRTVPCADLDRGIIAGLPRGHIYWEEEEADAVRSRPTSAADSPPTGVISGDAVRALLREHLRHHLVVVSGSGGLLEQRVGIVQGSPVAMLLCDHLLANVVDADLSHVLSEHSERSLLLRRVDDVLVATASPVAAQRCLHAMRCGWPSVGYTSNPSKLTLSSGCGGLVPWCGLLLHDTTLEVSVEWRRVAALLPQLCVGDPRSLHRGDREPLHLTQRLLAVLQLRVAPTTLCARLNSKPRQLQTFYEVGLLWSRVVLKKAQEVLPAAHRRAVAVLLLRPLAACVTRLWRLLRRHKHFLEARRSACDVSETEVRACVVAALHRTMQAKLRLLHSRALRLATAAAQRRLRGRVTPRARRGGGAAQTARRGRRTREQRRRLRRWCRQSARVPLRSFWWVAAAEVGLQWRHSLSSLCAAAAPGVGGAETASLLQEDGPASLHARALHATRTL